MGEETTESAGSELVSLFGDLFLREKSPPRRVIGSKLEGKHAPPQTAFCPEVGETGKISPFLSRPTFYNLIVLIY